MPITIYPIPEQEVTRIVCPACKEKVRGVALLKESKIRGLTFRCKKCGERFGVRTE